MHDWNLKKVSYSLLGFELSEYVIKNTTTSLSINRNNTIAENESFLYPYWYTMLVE